MSTLTAESPKGKALVGFLVAIWLTALVGAMAWFMRWETTPGPKGVWSGAAPVTKQWHLLMVAHTMCPCSRASLEELRSILAEDKTGLKATVVLTGPDAKPNSNATNVKLARSISGVDIVFCSEPQAVAEYHAKVSGQTYLFDPNGKVRFSGGLTEIRGEFGPSPGVDAIKRILAGSPEIVTTPTLGCALETSQD